MCANRINGLSLLPPELRLPMGMVHANLCYSTIYSYTHADAYASSEKSLSSPFSTALILPSMILMASGTSSSGAYWPADSTLTGVSVRAKRPRAERVGAERVGAQDRQAGTWAGAEAGADW